MFVGWVLDHDQIHGRYPDLSFVPSSLTKVSNRASLGRKRQRKVKTQSIRSFKGSFAEGALIPPIGIVRFGSQSNRPFNAVIRTTQDGKRRFACLVLRSANPNGSTDGAMTRQSICGGDCFFSVPPSCVPTYKCRSALSPTVTVQDGLDRVHLSL